MTERQLAWTRRLAVLLTVAVVFVLFAQGFARAVGWRPRWAWKLDGKRSLYGVSDDGGTVVTALDRPGHNSTVQVWDAATKSVRHAIEFGGVKTLRLAVSPDTSLLAVANQINENSIQIGVYELSTAERVGVIAMNASDINPPTAGEFTRLLLFTPDNRTLLYTERDSGKYILHTWDVPSRRYRARLGEMGHPYYFTLSNDSRTLATFESRAGETIKVWDLDSGKAKSVLRFDAADVRAIPYAYLFISPDGETLGRTQVGGGPIEVWDLSRLENARKFPKDNKSLWPGQLFPFRLFRAELTDNWLSAEDALTSLRIEGPRPIGVHESEFSRLSVLEHDGETHWCFRWSQDEKSPVQEWFERLFRPFHSQTRGGQNYFEVATGKYVGQIPGEPGAQSMNGAFMAASYSDGTIAVWDTPPRRPVGLILLLAALHTGLIVGTCWWWSRRS